MKSFEQLARSGYAAYCRQAGGVTLDGEPLPTYEQLGLERQLRWVAVARQIVAEMASVQ